MNRTKKGNADGGSGNKNMKKFPRILDYLEVHRKDVYSLIDDLAMHGSLTPKRGGSLTFLIPDTAYVTKIKKTIESDKPEDATDMIASLIIVDLYANSGDFQTKGDDVPNLLGKKISVTKVTDKAIEIKSGVLTAVPAFKPFDRQGNSKRGNLAVWDLKGTVDYEGAEKTTYKHIKSTNKHETKKVEGGYELQELNNLIKIIIDAELNSIGTGAKDSNGKWVSPMFNAVCGVLRAFPEDSDNHKKARSLITMHPVLDFFLLFYTPDIFDTNEVVNAYKASPKANDNNVDFIKSFASGKQYPEALILNNSGLEKLKKTSSGVVETLINSGHGITINKKIKEIYDNLDKSNRLLDLENVYPECLSNIFRSKENLHLALDENLYFMYSAIQYNVIKPTVDTWESDASRRLRQREYRNIFALFQECFSKLADPAKSQIVYPVIDKNDIYAYSTEFWRSFGLHMPCISDDKYSEIYNRVEIRGGNECNSIYSKDLINIDSEICNHLDNYENSELQLSNQTINELKAYLKNNNNKLPDFLNL